MEVEVATMMMMMMMMMAFKKPISPSDGRIVPKGVVYFDPRYTYTVKIRMSRSSTNTS